jgi:hypothetical protein
MEFAMPLAEGVSARIAYAKYATGNITPNALDDPLTAPGPTGGQALRRVSSTLALAKNTYQSAEIRSDRQIVDFRHGTQRVEGNIAGEISLGTYMDLFEAVHRDTRKAGPTTDQATLTSVAASASASTITFGGGDPITAGLGVGQVIRLAGTGTPNDGKNFTIVAFSGTNHRTVTVDPKPVDITTPVTTFTATRRVRAQVRRPPTSSSASSRSRCSTTISTSRGSIRNAASGAIGWRCRRPAWARWSSLSWDVRNTTRRPGPTLPARRRRPARAVLAAVNGSLYFGRQKIGVATSADLTMNALAHGGGSHRSELLGRDLPREGQS